MRDQWNNTTLKFYSILCIRNDGRVIQAHTHIHIHKCDIKKKFHVNYRQLNKSRYEQKISTAEIKFSSSFISVYSQKCAQALLSKRLHACISACIGA